MLEEIYIDENLSRVKLDWILRTSGGDIDDDLSNNHFRLFMQRKHLSLHRDLFYCFKCVI